MLVLFLHLFFCTVRDVSEISVEALLIMTLKALEYLKLEEVMTTRSLATVIEIPACADGRIEVASGAVPGRTD